MKHFNKEKRFDTLKEYETGIAHFEDGDTYERNLPTAETSATLTNTEENIIMLQQEVSDLKTTVKTYEKIIEYTRDYGVRQNLLEHVGDGTIRYIGEFDYTMSIKNGKPYITIDAEHVTLEYYMSDGYGVRQCDGFLGDDYHGYIAFPTFKKMMLFYYEM